MVIQTAIHNGVRVERKVYRNLVKQKHLAKYRTGFYAQREQNKAGAMWELRGDKKILLAGFGNIGDVVAL